MTDSPSGTLLPPRLRCLPQHRVHPSGSPISCTQLHETKHPATHSLPPLRLSIEICIFTPRIRSAGTTHPPIHPSTVPRAATAPRILISPDTSRRQTQHPSRKSRPAAAESTFHHLPEDGRGLPLGLHVLRASTSGHGRRRAMVISCAYVFRTMVLEYGLFVVLSDPTCIATASAHKCPFASAAQPSPAQQLCLLSSFRLCFSHVVRVPSRKIILVGSVPGP